MYMLFFFFFQAEDGIRDKLVTGVQTCALPISARCPPDRDRLHRSKPFRRSERISRESRRRGRSTPNIFRGGHPEKSRAGRAALPFEAALRSESRISALHSSRQKQR